MGTEEKGPENTKKESEKSARGVAMWILSSEMGSNATLRPCTERAWTRPPVSFPPSPRAGLFTDHVQMTDTRAKPEPHKEARVLDTTESLFQPLACLCQDR
nr:hypothetical protein HJG63_008417 [Rousettus aegyptiacus]